MGHYGLLVAQEQLDLPIHPMESTGLLPLLETLWLQRGVSQSLGMEQGGSLEDMEQIILPIHPMESHGLGRLLVMRCLQPSVSQSHGMEHYGSLQVKEHINSRILMME
jgi:hypothetical protein